MFYIMDHDENVMVVDIVNDEHTVMLDIMGIIDDEDTVMIDADIGPVVDSVVDDDSDDCDPAKVL